MAEYSMPPWVGRPADPAAHYAQGFQIGVHLGAQQAAHAFQAQQLAQQQQKMALAQQQQEFENQYQAQVLSLKAGEMARQHQAAQMYSQMVGSGMDPSRALMQLAPELGESPAGIIRAQQARDNERRMMAFREANQRRLVTNAQARQQHQAKALAEQIRHNQAIENKPKAAKMSPVNQSILSALTANVKSLNSAITRAQALDPNADVKLLVDQRNNLMDQLSRFESVSGGEEAPAATEVATPDEEEEDTGAVGNNTMPDVSPKRVRVKSPDGKTGTLPADQVDAAVKAGYTLL